MEKTPSSGGKKEIKPRRIDTSSMTAEETTRQNMQMILDSEIDKDYRWTSVSLSRKIPYKKLTFELRVFHVINTQMQPVSRSAKRTKTKKWRYT